MAVAAAWRVTAERSCPCKQPACLAVGGGLEVTFKPLVPRLSVREGFLALTSPGIEALEEGGAEMESVAEITTLEEGACRALVVPNARHYSEQTAAVQTDAGTVQLVQIRIPTDTDGQTWINILQPSDQ
ncbi:hypothetical protein J6590_086779 [Homalodisca vitripennis]|nr:hypothetical protein J6590_086779 [Homalodisca vitripennis]